MAKIATAKINTWSEADNWLRKMGEAEARIAKREADLTLEVARLKRVCATNCAGDLATVQVATGALRKFWRDNKPEGAKSRKLTFGTIGSRASRFVNLLQPVEDVLTFLSALGEFIRTKQEVDKKALLEASEADLGLLDDYVAIETKETFFADADQEAIARGEEVAA